MSISNDNKCCMCNTPVPIGPLFCPFPDGGYPIVYGILCSGCKDDCKSGRITREQFNKVARPVPREK